MSLGSASTKVGATLSTTGGTDLAWNSTGLVSQKNVLVASADTDLRTRRQIEATVKLPTANAVAPNGYTQARSAVLFKAPKILANGKITVNTLRIELAYDVETTPTEIDAMLLQGGQFCFNTDFTPVFKQLALN